VGAKSGAGGCAIHDSRFSDAYSPWSFLAALSYAFAAFICVLNDPRYILFPFTVILARQRVDPLAWSTPLYFESDGLLNFLLCHTFCVCVTALRFALRLSRPLWFMWSENMPGGTFITRLCIWRFFLGAFLPFVSEWTAYHVRGPLCACHLYLASLSKSWGSTIANFPIESGILRNG